jgi:phage baseplate assembly protein V
MKGEPEEYRLSELERRLDNLLRIGTVAEADYAAARVRVRSGDLLTGWIPWLTRRAAGDIDWWAPEVGEQVLLLAPCGDPAQAVCLPAIYQAAHPAPESVATVSRIEFRDGGFARYDRASGVLVVSTEGLCKIVGKGTVEIYGAAGVTVNGVVMGDCICAFTGRPHIMRSSNVKASV